MQCVMHDNNILLIWSQLTLSFIMLMWPPVLVHQPMSEYGPSIYGCWGQYLIYLYLILSNYNVDQWTQIFNVYKVES